MGDEDEKTENIVRSGAPGEHHSYAETPSGAQLAWRRRSELVAKGLDPDSGEHEVLSRDDFDPLDKPVVLSEHLLAAAARIIEQDASKRGEDTLSTAARVLSSSLVTAARTQNTLRARRDTGELSRAQIFESDNILAAATLVSAEQETLPTIAARSEQESGELSVEVVTDLLTRFAEHVAKSDPTPADAALDAADLERLDEMLHTFLCEAMRVEE